MAKLSIKGLSTLTGKDELIHMYNQMATDWLHVMWIECYKCFMATLHNIKLTNVADIDWFIAQNNLILYHRPNTYKRHKGLEWDAHLIEIVLPQYNLIPVCTLMSLLKVI